jgi:hypothetical protein
MKKLIAGLKSLLFLSLLVPVLAIAQNAPQPASQNGPTVTITANVSGSIPTPVQATSQPTFTQQYILTNIDSLDPAFVSHAVSAAQATTNCVVPTGTPRQVYVVLPLTQIIVTDIQNAFFCAITSSGTAILYITPVVGQ